MRLIHLLKQDLGRELRDWVRDGLIERDQAQRIGARYGIDYANPVQHGFGYRVLIALGYLFIGLSLLTLIGANWDEIPRWLRTAGLMGLVLITHLRGWQLERAGQRDAAVGWCFLGSLFYGAAIMLIAQIYHLGEHFPDGIFWWALGVLPLAMLLQSRLLSGLMLGLAFIWFFVEADQPFFPVWFPLFLSVAAYRLWRGETSNLLFLATVAGVVLYLEAALAWWLLPGYAFDLGPENFALGVGLALLLWLFAHWLGSRVNPSAQEYALSLGLWVSRFFILVLVVFSFREPWHGLLIDEWRHPVLGMAMLLLPAAVAVTLARALGLAWRALLATALLSLAMIGLAMSAVGRDGLMLLQVSDNLLLIALGVWLIVRGLSEQSSREFHAGVGLILLTGLLRYLDLIGDYVGAAILFAVFAAILLAAARFWKARFTVGRQ